MSQLKEGGRKEFPVLVKADVQGSAEAIVQALEKIGNDEIRGAGHPLRGGRHQRKRRSGWRRPPVPCCSASTSAPMARRGDAAERQGIEIRYYNIIYDLVDDIKPAMSGQSGAGTARNLPRQCADPRGLQHHQGRQGGRLPGYRRLGAARRQGALDPRQCGHSRRHALDAQALQGRGHAKCRSARNAAWPSRTTRTCAQATSSNASVSRRSSGL